MGALTTMETMSRVTAGGPRSLSRLRTGPSRWAVLLHRNYCSDRPQDRPHRSYVRGRCDGRGMSPETLLAFEAQWPRHTPDKDATIRRELGITPARFYQLLGRAAATVEGISADPITARRVRERGARNQVF